MPEQLVASVYTKVRRAQSQCSDLFEFIEKWIVVNPLSARCELLEGRLGFRLVVEGPIDLESLEQASLQVGEYLHNLRSSLDNLVFALARTKLDPPERPGNLFFPICENEAQFDEKRVQKCLNQLPDQANAVLRALQPFNGESLFNQAELGYNPLLLLHTLSNFDKHRVPSLVLVAPEKVSHSVQVEFYNDDEAMANLPPDVTINCEPLAPGTVLMETRTKHPVKSVAGNFNGAGRVAIETPNGPFVAFPTLRIVGQFVDIIHVNLNRFLGEKG